ncbi:hypothetical protein [Corallococcus terminator]|nr:hypothetical protein [Corallococcus terminator]
MQSMFGSWRLAAVLCLALAPACAHYRVQAPGHAGSGATEPEGEVLWSLA